MPRDIKDPLENVSETIKQSLIEILKNIENEDMYIRQRMLRECKQLELYWHGFQFIFWDERVQDFRVPTHDVMEQISSREETKFIYDYVVNIFKAHGLSIIAALSAEIPGVSLSPVDADNPRDVQAAQKAEQIGKIIQKYNKSKLIFYHALFTLFTNHFVAAYNCYETDEKYGTLEVPEYGEEKEPDTWNCPECEFSSQQELLNCPDCSSPLEKEEGEDILVETGKKEVNRGMELLKIKGALNVKIPTYASDQSACGYLVDYSDQHFAFLRTEFPWKREEISLNATDNFERIARMPSIGRLYSDTYLQSLLTFKRVWIRPWMYDTLELDDADELREAYPKGCYFSVIDGVQYPIEIREERLDDHWSITKGDLSRAIHGDPLGKPLLPLQDLENMVANLLTESLEHSVPSTWADPEVIDFDKYSKQEVAPGALYPIKNSVNPNRRLDDYFYTLKTSTLPKEGVDFDRIVETKGQFVVGAFPSIFGGPQTEGSKTLGEYQESRNYALQRLSIPYQLLMFWWADVLYKGIKDYIANMIVDEKYTEKSGDGRFSSVILLKDDFTRGRFEQLLPESAIDLPTSFSQKRTNIQQMVQLNSDLINQFLFSPENRRVTLKFLGIEELSDLDSNQSYKQLIEIEELLKSGPVPDEQTGQIIPTIPIEPDIDDDEIHLRVIRTFVCSPSGQEMKKLNPDGYENLLLHGRAHKLNLQMNMMQPPGPPNSQGEQENVNTK